VDKNPALKAFFMALVKEKEMITGKRIALLQLMAWNRLS
jgi:hypothetical protein